jgi:hypothetical protein
MTEAPRYRIRHDVLVHAIPYRTGAEITWNGWPAGTSIVGANNLGEPHLDPINEPARRIFAYYTKHRHSPGFPATPTDRRTGRFYLPAHFHRDGRAKRFPAAVPDGEATRKMPRYLSTLGGLILPTDDMHAKNAHGVMFGNRIVEPGTEITFLAWPAIDFRLEPANDVARAIAIYYDVYAEHPELPIAPWDFFTGAPFLPELTNEVHDARGRPRSFAPPHAFKPQRLSTDTTTERRTYGRDPSHARHR